jgi:hypothetical protein
MKNHFGSIHNPRRLHDTIHDSIAELNAHRFIVNKTRLILVDGIYTMYRWDEKNLQNHKHVDITNQLLFGSDPVAVDTVGWNTISSIRKRHGLKPIEPTPEYINIAASQYSLGNKDLQKINLKDI